MSSGDIDDILGSAAQLQRYLEQSDDLRTYLLIADSLPILRATIPYGAGISTDGQTRYIDSRIDTIFNGVDVGSALARHESVEWGLREFCGVGVDYANDPMGHRLANRAELDKLNELIPNYANDMANLWADYDDFIDPQIREIEYAPLDENVPLDLAMYPYEGTPLYEKIRKVQNGQPRQA